MDEQSGLARDQFRSDPSGLPPARAPEIVQLSDAESYALRIAPVAKRIGEATVRMLAFNGSVPGPSLRVDQGSEVTVHVMNEGDTATTVHWHGVRVDNWYDGTPETQAPIPVGGSFAYRVVFPDAGAYWYHPHVREDYNQELGLYGTIVVEPAERDYWPPANRELALTLDDLLIEDGRIAPFQRAETTYAAMGRYGNVMLVNGEPDLELSARRGEVVRFYFTDTANTRTFNVGFAGARMKLVGGDSGRYEHEQLVDSVLISPSERAVVDVVFDQPGPVMLEHRTPDRTYELATVTVTDEPAQPPLAGRFDELRTDPQLVAERERLLPYLEADPDKTIALVAEMHRAGGHDAHHHQPHHHGNPEHRAGPPAAIEWEDEMVEMNRATTGSTMRWKLVDRDTGLDGQAIDWRFRVGDRVKLRLVNETASDHPMQHPIHIHGAGRFLVIARDGVVEPNLVWKDTVLVPTGETTDILLEVTNPGVWMVHCHIAEHHESGMMFSFTVDPTAKR
jgi:FtsP/CotA-like multicopper oxidase with cupredoxin domain